MSQSRRVLFVHDSLDAWGGGEIVMTRAAERVRQRAALDVAVVWQHARHVRVRELGEAPLHELGFPTRFGFRDLPGIWMAQRRLQALVDRLRPAACIAFSYASMVRLALLKHGPFRLAWVCQEDPAGLFSRNRSLSRKLAGALLRSSDCIVATLSEPAVLSLVDNGFASERVLEVPQGIAVESFRGLPLDLAERATLRAEHRVPGGLVVVCVAHVTPIKRHATLIDALARVRAEGLDLTLVAVGATDLGGGACIRELREQAARLGVAEHVIWVGDVTDPVPWYAMADFAALASESELAPLTVLEAGAAGLPLLVSDLPGTRALVQPGTTAILFPAGDTAACAAAMTRLSRDAELRARMSVAARRHVSETRSAERTNRAWDALIGKLMETP